MLNNFGIQTKFEGEYISVVPVKIPIIETQVIESDWSSASYFFSIVALSKKSEIRLSSYREKSLQGDAILRVIFNDLGVKSHFEGDTLVLNKDSKILPNKVKLDLSKAPDIAQTIAVTCYGLGVDCDLMGLHTLKIKETDRLEALQVELSKLGASISVTDKSLHLVSNNNFISNCSIDTYNDHRMAMAFAPLALKIPIQINASEVVSKSYPDFWDDLKQLNFQIVNR